MFRFSRTSKSRLSTVDTRLQEITERALQISKVDFGIPEFGGMRTAEDQNSLYIKGLSTLDGYKKKSYHQTGKAIDLFAFADGSACWDSERLTHIAAAMLQASSELGYKLTWGGFWTNFVDMPHFQLED